MNTSEFIEAWNCGNERDRANLVTELGLKTKSRGVMAVQVKDKNISSLHFMAIPELRAGIWYAKTTEGKRQALGAFRLYARGQQTFNSWKRVCINLVNAEALKMQFLHAFDNIVTPGYTDN